jgi:hemin uptake protein HemP
MSSGDGDSRSGPSSGEPPMFSGGERTVRLLDNRVDSRDLFVATREIMIAHGEDVYRLRLTAQNKLILTK